MPNRSPSLTPLIPEFCKTETVVRLVMLAQAIAIVLALVPGTHDDFWSRLGFISLFLHWILLLLAAVLCWFRRPLSKVKPSLLGYLVLLILLLLTFAVSNVAYRWLPNTDLSLPAFLLQTMLMALILGGIGVLMFSLYVQHSWRLDAQSRAEFDALQARIQPHFLFNSLNTAAELIHTDPYAAETALLDLSSLFRAAMQAGAAVRLQDELHLGQQYLALERWRLGDRLQIEWQVPTDSATDMAMVQLPCLTIQPLLENAIRHGIEPNASTGWLRLTVLAQQHTVTILVENSVGEAKSHHTGHGMALDNIRRRLELMFAERASCSVAAVEQTYRVKIVVPKGMV